jgi:small nuclear ribonucleoprotein (snRNP)-like protein
MKNWADEITNNPLAVHLGATVVNVTKIQEIDDPKGDTFNVVLVSGVTAWGKLDQYDAAMQKYLDYLSLVHSKLWIDISQAQEFETISNIEVNSNKLTVPTEITNAKYRDLLNGRPESK